MDPKYFFDTYVFGWMCRDIEREIDWAKTGKDAGNALCALGLLAYTEFMATQLPAPRRPLGGARQHFDAFFRELGQPYADLLDHSRLNVYDVFRCGLAHEYFVKGTCTIAMLNSTPGQLEVAGAFLPGSSCPSREPSAFVPKPVTCGVGQASNGSLFFVVEQYCLDFRNACDRLLHELQQRATQYTSPTGYGQLSDSNASF